MNYRITSFPMNAAELESASLVTGAFPDCASASRALEFSVSRGYSAADLSILMTDEARRSAFRTDRRPPGDMAPESADRASASASAAITARLALIGRTVPLPGIRIIVAGPIADALNGSNPVVGGVADLGFPAHRAPRVDELLRQGRVILVLQARSPMDAQNVESSWKEWAIEVLA